MRTIFFLLALLVCNVAHATTPCALRWDAWYGSDPGDPDSTFNPPSVNAETAAVVGAAPFQFRAPWFAQPTSANSMTIDGSQQATIDAEIAYAKAANIKCWAFDWYQPTAGQQGSSMMRAWRLYQTSTHKADVSWAMTMQFSRIGNSAAWNAAVASYVTYFQQSNYQKVTVGTANRPVVFFLVDDLATLTSNWGGSWANVQTAFNTLRTATTGAGLGTPYIVMLYGTQSQAASFATQTSADAISNYSAGIGSAGYATPWATAVTNAEAFWGTINTAATGAGLGMVPIATTGWDTRPFKNTPVKFYPSNGAHTGQSAYFVAATPLQITNHLQAAVTYVGANAAVNPSGLILVYSWTECAEGGGCLIPTYSAGGPVTTLLNAAGAVTW
jgi:hypothetical protein